MRENLATVTLYATTAAFAAASLAYVFGPSLYPDPDAHVSSRSAVVGLANYGNDCYINAVLQAIAGLTRFETSLSQHCQKLEDLSKVVISDRQYASNEEGVAVAPALRTMLSRLHETPGHAKTISAKPLIRALERASGALISKRQQDAHELLQVLLERICGEYREQPIPVKDMREDGHRPPPAGDTDEAAEVLDGAEKTCSSLDSASPVSCFPFEGILSSQIECLTCHYKPNATQSSFVTLSLSVPQKNSTSLDECLDGLLKQELVDDYKCDCCRLNVLIASKEQELLRDIPVDRKIVTEGDLRKLLHVQKQPSADALEKVAFPDAVPAPARRIARHTRIKEYPNILAIHLSRSVFESSYSSHKNRAKVKFQDLLSLGLLERKLYRLAAMITHLGGHNSGHYEAFRRQEVDRRKVSKSAPERRSGSQVSQETARMNIAKQDQSQHSSQHLEQRTSHKDRPTRDARRWWRISDDKVRQSTTDAILGTQEQVYLLFYELENSTNDSLRS